MGFFICGKTNINYQSHVIIGSSAEDPKWHGSLGLAGIVHGYCTQIVTERSGQLDYVDVPEGHIVNGTRAFRPVTTNDLVLSSLASSRR